MKGKAPAWIPFFLALVSSIVFCFVIYPRISDSHNAVLDPDGHGRLGFGLWKHGTLSYFPDTDPIVARGPAYPALLAVTLAVTRGWWPYGAQLAQCILFALTALLVFHLADVCWGRRFALAVSAVFALYPFSIWYTSRIWVETFAAFLLAALAALMLALRRRTDTPTAVLFGMTLGIAILCKSTFLPIAVVLPLLLVQGRWRDRDAILRILLVPLVAMLVVAPWTLRNARLTGRFIPVQSFIGTPMLDGDYVALHFAEASFSCSGPCAAAAREEADRIIAAIPPDLRGAAHNVAYDRAVVRNRMRYYAAHPLFPLRKAALNAVFFWTLGETPGKTRAVALLLAPVALLFFASLARLIIRRRLLSQPGLLAILMLTYYLPHLLVNAFGRFAVPLVPVMLVVGAGLFAGPAAREDAA